MAITHVGTVVTKAGQIFKSSGWSMSVTVPSGSDRLLVVGTRTSDSNDYISNWSFNGAALTPLGTVGANTTNLFYLVAPDEGTFNLVASFGGGGSSLNASSAWAAVFTGIDQAAPLGNTDTTTSDSASPYQTSVAISAGSLLVGYLSGALANRPFTPIAGVTELADFDGVGAVSSVWGDFAGYRVEASAGTYDVGATSANDASTNVRAAEFKAATSAGGTTYEASADFALSLNHTAANNATMDAAAAFALSLNQAAAGGSVYEAEVTFDLGLGKTATATLDIPASLVLAVSLGKTAAAQLDAAGEATMGLSQGMTAASQADLVAAAEIGLQLAQAAGGTADMEAAATLGLEVAAAVLDELNPVPPEPLERPGPGMLVNVNRLMNR